MRFINYIFIFLLFLLIFSIPTHGSFPVQGSFYSLNSETLSSYSQFDNEYILVETFATWCIPCIEEFYEISKINSLYANYMHFLSLSVSPSTDNFDNVRSFILNSENTYNFTLNWAVGLEQIDKQTFSNYFNISVIPSTYLITSSGELKAKWEGLVNASEIINFIDTEISFVSTLDKGFSINQNFTTAISIFTFMIIISYFFTPKLKKIKN